MSVLDGSRVLSDAEETLRKWKLGCVQAEAELRALQGQAVVEKTQNSDAESQATLAKIIALERHIDELESWRGHVHEEVVAAETHVEASAERVDSKRNHAERVGSEAGAMSRQAAEQLQRREEARAEHESVCSQLRLEVQQQLADTRLHSQIQLELDDVETTIAQLCPTVVGMADGANALREERERQRMHREELRHRFWHYIDAKAQSVRDIATAKQHIQSRAAQLKKLQGEVARTRSQADRKRRQVENQLTQMRSELKDAEARVESSGDALRKVRQRHGLELKKLRQSTGALKDEVDERLLSIEQAETDLERVRMQESEMEEDRRLHEGRELYLEEEAAASRRETQRLETKIGGEEAAHSACQDRLLAAESEHEAAKLEWLSIEERSAALQRRNDEAVSVSSIMQSELREEQAECSGQSTEIETLRELEEQLQSAQIRKGQLSQESAQIDDGMKQTQRSFDRFLTDMREVSRRLTRVQASHGELLNSLPSGRTGREAMIGAIDQAMGRVVKRVDAVLSYLENKDAGQKKPANIDMLATSQRSQAALQSRLVAEAEKNMEKTLAQEKKNVLSEQQGMLDEVKRRTAELQNMRQDRRQLEAQLAHVKEELEIVRASGKVEHEGLQEQLELVGDESTHGVEAATAEFSDLLQKQALERSLLQKHVEDLRSELDLKKAAAAEDHNVEDAETNDNDINALSPATLQQRLAEAEAEAEALRMDEETLLQSHVKLKAVMFVAKQQAKKSSSSIRSATGDGSALGGRHDLKKPSSPDGPRAVTPTARDTRGDAIGDGLALGSRQDLKKTSSPDGPRAVTPTAKGTSRDASKDALGTPEISAMVPPATLIDTAGSGQGGGDEANAADRTLEEEPEAASTPHVPSPQNVTPPQPRLQLSQHQRSLSTRTNESAPGSSANLAMTWPVVGPVGPLSGSLRSVSTHSVSTPASTPTQHANRSLMVPPGSLGSTSALQGALVSSGSAPNVHAVKAVSTSQVPPLHACHVVAASQSSSTLQSSMTPGLPVQKRAAGSPLQIRRGETVEASQQLVPAHVPSLSYGNVSTWPPLSTPSILPNPPIRCMRTLG